MALLHIYDASDPHIVATATERLDPGRILMGIRSGSNLIPRLDAFVAGRTWAFDRILFETHGSPGRIYFGSNYIDAGWIRSSMAGRGYERLCPRPTRVYFNGCNVAAEPGGRDFLTAFASVWLHAGGTIFGHTSLGLELPGWAQATGHVVHLSGERITLQAGTGGRITGSASAYDLL